MRIMAAVCPHVRHAELCYFPCLQMQPSHAAPLSLSVGTGGASPASGSAMKLTTVAMELMNCPQPAVCYFITEHL